MANEKGTRKKKLGKCVMPKLKCDHAATGMADVSTMADPGPSAVHSSMRVALLVAGAAAGREVRLAGHVTYLRRPMFIELTAACVGKVCRAGVLY